MSDLETGQKKPNMTILLGGVGALLAVVIGIVAIKRSSSPDKPKNADEASVAEQGEKVRKKAETDARQITPSALGEGLKYDAQGNLLGAPAAVGGLENQTLTNLKNRPASGVAAPADSINAGIDYSQASSGNAPSGSASYAGGYGAGSPSYLRSGDPEQVRTDRKEERDLYAASMLAYSKNRPMPRAATQQNQQGSSQNQSSSAAARGPEKDATLNDLVQQSKDLGLFPGERGAGPKGLVAGEGASNKPMKSPPGEVADMRIGGGPSFLIHEGQFLDLVLSNKIEASFAGSPVVAVVNRDFLSPDGKYVLIPHGTQVLGEAGRVESVQQARVYIAFHRAIFPDGRAAYFPQHLLPLGMTGDGSYGVQGRVNRHFWLQFGSAIALGLIDGLAAAAGGPTDVNINTGIARQTTGQLVGQRVSNDLQPVIQSIIQKYANVVPTVSLKPGTRMKLYFIEDTKVNALALSRPVGSSSAGRMSP
jgi:type IV secretory pathway VirB10-like protein